MYLIRMCLVIMISSVLFAMPGEKKLSGAESIDLTRGTFFEVSPYAGVMSGSGLFGLRLGMNYAALNIEASGEQVIGKTANTYPIMLNFMLNLSKTGKLLPFVAAGGGLMLTVPTNAIGSETISSLGASFGLGTRYYLTNKFGFVLAARQYLTVISNEIEGKDEYLNFQELSLGVTFMFN